MITWAQMGLQDAASPIIEEFIFFNDFTLLILLSIILVVGVMISLAGVSPWVNSNLLQQQTIEGVWTVLPALILIQIAAPSLILLYVAEDLSLRHIMCKTIGHQWYWTYEIRLTPSLDSVEMESFMAAPSGGKPRLLRTDDFIRLPVGVRARILVTSEDVLHSWTVPALGVKADAVPGRLNQINLTVTRAGTFFGQCSEICGANHRFIPIMLEINQLSKTF